MVSNLGRGNLGELYDFFMTVLKASDSIDLICGSTKLVRKLDITCREIVLSSVTMVGMQLLLFFGGGQLLETIENEQMPLRYEIQRVFGHNLIDGSTRSLYPRLLDKEELEPTTHILVQDWAAVLENDEKFLLLKSELLSILRFWSKSSVCLIGYGQLLNSIVQRLDKELNSEQIRHAELYTLACILANLTSHMDLRLNLGRMDYDDLCEVNQN